MPGIPLPLFPAYDVRCPECGALYIPYEETLPCPSCGHVQRVSNDFLPALVDRAYLSENTFGKFLFHGSAEYSFSFELARLILDMLEFHRRRTGFAKFKDSVETYFELVDFEGIEYLKDHVRDLAEQVYERIGTLRTGNAVAPPANTIQG